MKHIFYNPYSSSGKTKKDALKLNKKLRKTEEVMIHRLRTFDDFKNYVSKLKENDEIIIVGGDGTIHYILNDLQTLKYDFRVFVYRSGSGNDFARDHKGKLFEITNEIKKLPYILYNDVDQNSKKEYFMNGAGTGIDANTCFIANNRDKKKSYFKIAKESFTVIRKFYLMLTGLMNFVRTKIYLSCVHMKIGLVKIIMPTDCTLMQRVIKYWQMKFTLACVNWNF